MEPTQPNAPDDAKGPADRESARSGALDKVEGRGDMRAYSGALMEDDDTLYPMDDVMHMAMLRAEAQEYGLLEDDSGEDPLEIPEGILAEMGIEPEEVGQRAST